MIALFLAMGGVSYGLAGSNSVTKDDLSANSVGKSEIRTGAGGKTELGRDSVGTNEALEETDKGGGFTTAQIKEETLGKVPDADKLDGLDSSALVRGAGTGNVLTAPDNATSGRILALAGIATLDVASCDDDGAGGDDGVTIRVTNTSGAAFELVEGLFADGDVATATVAAGATRDTVSPGDDIVNLSLVGSGRQGQADVAIDLSGAGCKLVARGLSSTG